MEADGDPSDGFDGVNLTEGSGSRGGERKVNEWRLEIESAEHSTQTRFLTVHLPRLVQDNRPETRIELLEGGDSYHAVVVGETVVLFADLFRPLRSFTLSTGAGDQFLILDAVPGAVYAVGERRLRATEEGVLLFNKESADRLRIEVVE